MDMPEAEREAFLRWLETAVDPSGMLTFAAWVVGEEKGSEMLLHLQCVVHCTVTQAQALTLRVKGALHWNKPPVRSCSTYCLMT